MKIQVGLVFALVIGSAAFYFFKKTRSSGEALRNLCSCLYVMDRDESMCRRWAGLGVSEASVDTASRRVFKNSYSSVWLGSREGCSALNE